MYNTNMHEIKVLTRVLELGWPIAMLTCITETGLMYVEAEVWQDCPSLSVHIITLFTCGHVVMHIGDCLIAGAMGSETKT